jgi:signal transduction histidine kinase
LEYSDRLTGCFGQRQRHRHQRADQKQIFDKFQQVVDPTRGRPPGTGLGLSITRQIIRHHRGELKVKSTPAKGATFYFSLPFNAMPAIPAQ